MATLKPMHDLSAFTSSESQRYALGNVKYDAQRQRLIATDGRIAITAPVAGNSCPDVLLPAKSLASLIGKGVEMTGDDRGVKLGSKPAPQPLPGDYPDTDRHLLPSDAPNVLWCISPKYLRTLAEYAERVGADVIHFGIRAQKNDRLNMLAPAEIHSKDAGVSFFFYPQGETEPVTGNVMHCELDNHARVRDGFRKAIGGRPAGTAKSKSPAQPPGPARPVAGKAESKPKASQPKATKPRAAKPPKQPSPLFLERKIRSAADRGDIAALDYAVEHGVNVDAGDREGYNALTRAALENQVAYLSRLIEHGANVNHKPKSKITALHTAAFCGHVEVVKLLLKHGAKVNVRDEDGDTPIDNAKMEGHTAIVRLLQAKA